MEVNSQEKWKREKRKRDDSLTKSKSLTGNRNGLVKGMYYLTHLNFEIHGFAPFYLQGCLCFPTGKKTIES